MSDAKEDGEFYPKYWICNTCADRKGWKVCDWPHTVVLDQKCGWCKSGITESHLTPICDFDKPSGEKAEWD